MEFIDFTEVVKNNVVIERTAMFTDDLGDTIHITEYGVMIMMLNGAGMLTDEEFDEGMPELCGDDIKL
jgi:hypothetical protein